MALSRRRYPRGRRICDEKAHRLVPRRPLVWPCVLCRSPLHAPLERATSMGYLDPGWAREPLTCRQTREQLPPPPLLVTELFTCSKGHIVQSVQRSEQWHERLQVVLPRVSSSGCGRNEAAAFVPFKLCSMVRALRDLGRSIPNLQEDLYSDLFKHSLVQGVHEAKSNVQCAWADAAL